MHKAYIEPHKCIRCPKCTAARVCPIKAIIRIGAEDPNVVDPNLCHGCGDCVSVCSGQAVILREG
ncbi:MAG: 4Fe-4S dicluster domain-containing protein [Betaproteobacteria bacterium]